MSHGVGCKRCWDPVLLWLWCRPASTALIRPLAWELPHAAGAALKKKKKIHIITYMWNLKYDTNEHIYKTKTDYRHGKQI